MRSPAAAITWELWRVSRGPFALSVVCPFLLAILVLAMPPDARSLDALPPWLLILGVPLAGVLEVALFLVPVKLSYVEGNSDMAARESIFPARLFTLPVRSSLLAGLPLALGLVYLGLAMLLLAELALRPAGLPTPQGMLPLAAAESLAWFLALLWWPFPLPFLRLIALLVFFSLDGLVLRAVVGNTRSPALWGLLTALLGSGWVLAFLGVRRARRGDVPVWSWLPGIARAHKEKRRHQPFASPLRAQVWLEWRQSGLMLPFMIVFIVPFHLVFLFLGENDLLPVSRIVGLLFIQPPFLAGATGLTLGRASPWVRGFRESNQVSTFTAARPVSSAFLVGAKLGAAALSTLAGWGVVLAEALLFLLLAHKGHLLVDGVRMLLDHDPRVPAPGLILAGAVGLVLLTWRQMVGNLHLTLGGRPWVFWLKFLLDLALLGAGAWAALWTSRHPLYLDLVLSLATLLAGAFAGVEILTAAWSVARLKRQGLLNARTLNRLIIGWLGAVILLFGLFVWLVPAKLVPLNVLAIACVLLLPPGRLAAAPLALAWNRHR